MAFKSALVPLEILQEVWGGTLPTKKVLVPSDLFAETLRGLEQARVWFADGLWVQQSYKQMNYHENIDASLAHYCIMGAFREIDGRAQPYITLAAYLALPRDAHERQEGYGEFERISEYLLQKLPIFADSIYYSSNDDTWYFDDSLERHDPEEDEDGLRDESYYVIKGLAYTESEVELFIERLNWIGSVLISFNDWPYTRVSHVVSLLDIAQDLVELIPSAVPA